MVKLEKIEKKSTTIFSCGRRTAYKSRRGIPVGIFPENARKIGRTVCKICTT